MALSTTMQGTPKAPSPNSPNTQLKFGESNLDKPASPGVLGSVTEVTSESLNKQPASLETTMNNPLGLTFHK